MIALPKEIFIIFISLGSIIHGRLLQSGTGFPMGSFSHSPTHFVNISMPDSRIFLFPTLLIFKYISKSFPVDNFKIFAMSLFLWKKLYPNANSENIKAQIDII